MWRCGPALSPLLPTVPRSDAGAVIDPHLTSAQLVERLGWCIAQAVSGVLRRDERLVAPLDVLPVDADDDARLRGIDRHVHREREVDALVVAGTVLARRVRQEIGIVRHLV